MIYRVVNTRTTLSQSEMQYYWTLEKGYEGEVQFDHLLAPLQGEFIILNDLLFEINNTYFQIDSLLLAPEKIHLYDVKNFENDYIIDNDNNWYSILKNDRKKESKNPIHQLNRCELLLKQQLQRLGFKSPITSKLVFVNPNFYLYQAPPNHPIIFPTQLDRFVNQLNSQLTTAKLKERDFKLAQQLLQNHKDESPFKNRPDYTFEGLKKGIYCKSCQSFDVFTNPKTIVCNKCGFREKIEAAVLRNVEEYKMLFPDIKVTTTAISEWCGIIKSDNTIRKVLTTNYQSIGKQRGTHYI
ncbi:nuclease-related domain-containing protein [Schinkia azotoformans]|nr:nuclease-related domain-containing protein [Schinkia azotoformans]MEC1638470.1 nuclease-related domain-containing protein [Schinkia azotoformans]MEC1721327.1 nuclease-related domain-containing protein [Schinkia azotoformans]MEC1946096.1 nuclease-related domain-containing protein [Schinkia azotoformans]MED4414474.1 nuclease-related domain-containing protein [Schinkia azotoformans]